MKPNGRKREIETSGRCIQVIVFQGHPHVTEVAVIGFTGAIFDACQPNKAYEVSAGSGLDFCCAIRQTGPATGAATLNVVSFVA
jgi:hypothetical protein